jgi:hypothetical protein
MVEQECHKIEIRDVGVWIRCNCGQNVRKGSLKPGKGLIHSYSAKIFGIFHVMESFSKTYTGTFFHH